MRTITRNILISALSLLPMAVLGQPGSPKPATYITKEEIDIVNKQPGGDRQIRVVDIGSENFAVGVVHRGPTGEPGAGGGGAGAARANTPPAEPCGERSRRRLRPAPPAASRTISRRRATTSFPAVERWLLAATS